MSVICTHKKELAEAVYWLVTAYGGRVNVYKEEKVSPGRFGPRMGRSLVCCEAVFEAFLRMTIKMYLQILEK
jgi:hypothetical protein